MKRTLACSALSLALAAVAAAQSPFKADAAWEHPFGDKKMAPCAHRRTVHKDGCPPPCTHPLVAKHKDGDDSQVPCTHFSLEHPGGHDSGAKSPCTHWKNGKLEHPEGHAIMNACTHWKAQHPHDTVRVPCVHLEVPHPNGDEGKMPCPHLEVEHKGGDEVWLPCAHPVKLVRQESNPPVNFYFDDKALSDDIMAGYRKLAGLGVKYVWPRPLSVYLREPVKGDPDDNGDPFWHHYDGNRHELVLTKDPAAYKVADPADRRRFMFAVAHHEMGHSLMHARCVTISTKGGKHTLLEEINAGTAMSEGWAQFIALVLANDRGAAEARRREGDKDFEAAHALTEDGRNVVAFTQRVEFRVGAVLWDLFDTRADGGDSLSLDFKTLWGVYSPTFETLAQGPQIADLNDFLQRLKNNNPGSKSQIDAVRDHNLTAPKKKGK